MTPNEQKKLILDYASKKKFTVHLSVTAREPNVVFVRYWPSMQGQGVVAAGYMALRWAKLVEYASKHGITLKK